MTFADLEQDLHAKPAFFVEKPDGRKDLSEHERQKRFVAFMRRANPHIEVYANMNHGARSQLKAMREGMVAGVLDLTIAWRIEDSTIPGAPTVAWCEFKGYSTAGRPGVLSQPQIEFGNRMAAKGFHVGCFFSARTLVEWLRDKGAPVRGSFT